MTSIPKPGDLAGAYTATYDAWNRLVRLADGAAAVADYEYDGQNYRTVKRVYASGALAETRHFYYNPQWQCLEERVEPSASSSSGDSSPAVDRQYVWGLRYVDDLILRDRDTTGDGTLDERLYAMQDANWNVVAVAASDGTIVERRIYDAYGQADPANTNVLAADFTPKAGGTDYAWEHTFTSRRLDAETGLMHYRNRYYHPAVGRFVTRDPIEADINLYRYCANNPLLYTDPTGRDWLDCMAACIKDNDPLPYALGAGIKAILLSGGWETKAMVAGMFKALGYTELAKDILHYANMPGASKLTNIMSTIGTVLSKMGSTQSTAMWHKLGGAASSILGPIEVAYGLSLAAVEVHCSGWCCTAWWYGIDYNHADGNVINAWKNYYFGG